MVDELVPPCLEDALRRKIEVREELSTIAFVYDVRWFRLEDHTVEALLARRSRAHDFNFLAAVPGARREVRNFGTFTSLDLARIMEHHRTAGARFIDPPHGSTQSVVRKLFAFAEAEEEASTSARDEADWVEGGIEQDDTDEGDTPVLTPRLRIASLSSTMEEILGELDNEVEEDEWPEERITITRDADALRRRTELIEHLFLGGASVVPAADSAIRNVRLVRSNFDTPFTVDRSELQPCGKLLDCAKYAFVFWILVCLFGILGLQFLACREGIVCL